MESRDQKFINYWTEKRKKGKLNYALKHGVFFFALPAFTISELVKYFIFGNHQVTIARIAVGLIIWGLGGFYIFGLYQWKGLEKRFQSLTKETDL